MILGIGIDIVEIDRIKKILERREISFLKRILTEQEQRNLPIHPKRKAEFVSGRFAAKEAVAKALGFGIGEKLSWLDIEINNEKSGKPSVEIKGTTPMKIDEMKIHLSISHSEHLAIAKVIIEQ